VRLFADRDLTAHIRVIFVLRKEGISTAQYLAQPFEYSRVIENLMLNQFLRDREDDLRTNVPESVQRRFWIPRLNLVWMVQH